MEGKDFFEFVFSLLTESGHVVTSDPVYTNHSSKEMLYVDSTADVMVSNMDRQLLLEVDNISLLQELTWSGQESGVDENVQIYSMEVNSLATCRSQDVARIHQLLCYYWSCTHSIVFFKSQNSFVISFADNLRSHILSDWYDFTEGGSILIEKLNIGTISLDSSNQYFEDFLFAVAREYYIYPISVEEASYGMIPIDYISNGLLLSLNSSKIDIKAMIRSNLRTYETQYGSDYIEPRHTGIEEHADYKDVTDEIDRLSFELEVANDDEVDYKPQDNVSNSDNCRDDEELFEDINPEIFDDPVLMIKWLEQSQKELDQQEFERSLVEAKRQEQMELESKQFEQKYLDAIHQEQERLEAERKERERLEAERQEQEQRHFAKQIVDTVINELVSRYPDRKNAPRSFEELNSSNLDLSLTTLDKWSQIAYGKTAISLLDQRGLLIRPLFNHQDPFEIEHGKQGHLESERQEQERLEAERCEQERLEDERQEQERLEAERREQERLEDEHQEQERLEAERREQERLEAEHREQERLEAERQERERLEAECREQERLRQETQKKRQFDSAKIYLEVSDSDPYSTWLAKNTSDEYIVEMYLAYAAIQKYANSHNLLSDSLLRTTDLRILWTLQEAIKSNKEFQKLGGNARYFCGLAMRYYMRYLSEIDAERKRLEQERLEAERRERERLNAEQREQERMKAARREQERMEAERQEQERMAMDRQIQFTQLEQSHLKTMKGIESQFLSQKRALKKQLAQLEEQRKEKEARLSKLTFIQFLEKRSLSADLETLDKKKRDLILLIHNAESDYISQQDQERMNFNLTLIEKGL